MALILAIESDRRQVNHLTAIVRGKLHAELVLGETAEGALERLGDRVPDLILTSPLLSPRDEQALGERLRRLNGVAAHVQMLTLPVFAGTAPRGSNARGGVLGALLGDRGQTSAPDGCDPAVFADQCREYLRRSAIERDARQPHQGIEVAIEPEPTIAVEPAPAEPVSIIAAVAALEQPLVIDAPVPAARQIVEEPEEEEVTVDIDLSDLLADSADETTGSVPADDDRGPAVYDLSADTLEIVEPAVEAPLAAAAADEPPAAPEPHEEEFDDWQQVVDALKRESARARVPRERKPAGDTRVEAASAPTPPAPAAASPDAEPPRPRRSKAIQDEWGMFDPAQAGMAALYERLEKITEDEEQQQQRPARPA